MCPNGWSIDRSGRIFHDPNIAAAQSGTTSLAELLGAFSYALDLTEGQPAGHSVRCAYMAGKLAKAIGLNTYERHRTHYAVLLKDLGCSSNAARIAELYATDDRSFKQDWKTISTGLPATLKFVFSRTGNRTNAFEKVGRIANILKNGDAIAQEMIETRCTRGAEIARCLRFDADVSQAIYHLDEHWDGSGRPNKLESYRIPLYSRIALLVQVAEVFYSQGGPEASREEVLRRAGTWLDPELAENFLALTEDPRFWSEMRSPFLDATVMAMAPHEEAMPVDEQYLDDIAAAFGLVVDAKSPFTAGHSGRVGIYAERMAREFGFVCDRRRRLKRAALLHDIGKLGVSSRLLEKPGKLGDDEWEEMQGHAAHTKNILSRIGVMADMADMASSHHERLDGAGYPLGLEQLEISRETRIITACDFYDALTADRPYREAMDRDDALAIIEGEIGKAVDGESYEALVAVTR